LQTGSALVPIRHSFGWHGIRSVFVTSGEVTMTPVMERNGTSLAGGTAERRNALRRRVLKGATLSFNRGYSAFECVVRNRSDGGARLSLAETFALPMTFRLTISGETETHTAHVVWRGLDQVGVRLD
jgi:hypothetical protein